MAKTINLIDVEITEIILTPDPLQASIAYKVLGDDAKVYDSGRIVLTDEDLPLANLDKIFATAITKIKNVQGI